MADDISGTKISALTADSSISDNDYLAGVDGDASPLKTKRFLFSAIKSWIQGWIAKSDVGLSNLANVLQYSAFNKPTAADVTYDNTVSGLSATDAKGAIDELASKKQEKIIASGILKGDGAGGVNTAAAGTDYEAPIATGTMALSSTWSGSGPWTQVATITGATVGANSKVDLQPTAAQMASLIADGVTALVAENTAGTVTVTAFGAAPSTSLSLQITVTEVA